ncbi:MAG TPA: isoprenylcysteine carboxylmethyltransferase family protein [Ktedonobacteraceae bacterium]|nr:isoprenylcysteine carboxylmethyltransferase family protein [Ktedonobacteraceae bacterium]
MAINIKALVGQFVYSILFFALPLFLAAGTLAWPAGWIFLVLTFGFGLALTLWLFRSNPGLLKERMAITKPNQKAWDKVWMALVAVPFIAWLVLMPLDAVRFHWSQVPLFLQVVGTILLFCSFYLSYVTFRENSYLSTMARIQRDRGQTVVSTGPYHYVRHPLYAAFLLFMLGTALLLGSWYGLLWGLIPVGMLAGRAILEERMLKEELEGYDAYMAQVNYRLIPYIW